MGGIFSFFSGLAALGTSFGLACKERNDSERQWEEDKEKGYSYAAQSRYDFNRGKLLQAYDIQAIMKCVQADYPRMNDLCAMEVAEAAVAKRLLEEETPYKYKPSENCKFFDLDKYAKDEFKREKGKAWW